MYSEVDQEPEDPQGLDQKFEAMAQASILPPESTNPK
jgi:hypothetical protein